MRWENTVAIDAPTEVVWQLTTDVEKWPSLTTTMQRVDRVDQGPLRVGSSARIKQPGQSTALWTVDHLDEGRAFSWRTRRMGLSMTGSHLVEPTPSGCRNTLAIEVTGRGARLFGIAFGALLRASLALENAGFKAAAERAGR
ncbi:hypothetical protein F4553_006833 [Allocatelliglobosispora scoriae]|uniref:Polyketide cyclase n=1 Tax=Allocatelliglobosispora scoriae TaxID=643052 RepID=A0A841C273_9ACTN|nr:SRPBCC family protein [Allocatelliglobosispora scoriae]MBB5873399.1 hypothetical protein [Allocatelliglobosispora scoriae]